MAWYRVLYWKHIPLGIKATDVNGTIRVDLPTRFQEAYEDDAKHTTRTDTAAYTPMLKWGELQAREGAAAEVAAAIAKELDDTWIEVEALALLERQYS